jgi:hypothetical protein
MNTNTKKRDKTWMRNKNQLKRPKVFNVTMVRNPDGTFHVIGGESKVLVRKNQFASQWVNVDTRDLTCEMRRSRITSL